jgi:hypothetical protein
MDMFIRRSYPNRKFVSKVPKFCRVFPTLFYKIEKNRKFVKNIGQKWSSPGEEGRRGGWLKVGNG